MPTLIPIQDPSDPRISAYAAVRERDLTGRQGRFIAEGEVVLRALLSRSRFPVESILLSETRLRPLQGLLQRAPGDVPVFVAPQDVMNGIAGFPIHRGVLAIGRRDKELSASQLLSRSGPNALILGLIGITNHDNVGGIFRNAAAFGADAVLLDETSCDPLYRKAIRVSVGASLMVPFAVGGRAQALVSELAGSGFDLIALSPSGLEVLTGVKRSGRTALLLGAEGRGLPAAILARARDVRIAMAAGFDSLNVATASGIALHHLASQVDPNS
jgi:tRNA G18 (ribose-2'-O)-methylase SpoU